MIIAKRARLTMQDGTDIQMTNLYNFEYQKGWGTLRISGNCVIKNELTVDTTLRFEEASIKTLEVEFEAE